MHSHSNILPANRTILRWLFLVILSTGSGFFQGYNRAAACQTEQFFNSHRSRNAGTIVAFKQPASNSKATIEDFKESAEIHLARQRSFANLNETRFNTASRQFASYSFELLKMNRLQGGTSSSYQSDSSFS
ncbi:hypothetical protein DYBT9623_02570 [Dyadobacter sp. CECT 9623]|uniref:Uncharacterized protein n=1 Tax=Dyadobacter linearis TaxID=2823330 RepID=A0ABN7R9N4_9BACT|nr:hypothetical protein [Dyadobacter sp. CECT 9623]CAG5069833.1 hypothetical protein DYBT9623_02570 [Dyadobacter sp. CECT 9623]